MEGWVESTEGREGGKISSHAELKLCGKNSWTYSCISIICRNHCAGETVGIFFLSFICTCVLIICTQRELQAIISIYWGGGVKCPEQM